MIAGRLEFRIQEEAKARIEAAAALAGQNVSDFARSAVLERAEAILRPQEQTLVPPDFFDALLRELDAPATTNERLTRAAREARKSIRRQ